MATLYARRLDNGDVALYYDEQATKLAGIHPAAYSDKPTRRNKYVNFNCARYKLQWLTPAEMA